MGFFGSERGVTESSAASRSQSEERFAGPTSRPVAVTGIDGFRVYVFDTGFQGLGPPFMGDGVCGLGLKRGNVGTHRPCPFPKSQ